MAHYNLIHLYTYYVALRSPTARLEFVTAIAAVDDVSTAAANHASATAHLMSLQHEKEEHTSHQAGS